MLLSLGIGALAVVYGVAWLVLGGGPRVEARLSEGIQGALRRDVARVPLLPVLRDDDEAATGDVQTVEAMVRQRASLAALDEERVDEGDVVAVVMPPADTEVDPSALLQARLSQIAAEAGALQGDSVAFARACQSELMPSSASECGWLVDLRRGPSAGFGSEPADEGSAGALASAEQRDEGTAAPGCQEVWRGLLGRVSALAEALDKVETLAYQEAMPPTQWRQLVTSRGLMCF